jgi:predicted metal-dependent peptidase
MGDATTPGRRTPRTLTDDEQTTFSALIVRSLANYPYMAAALLRLSPVAVDGLGTMACDRFWRVYIDFATVEEWGYRDAAGVVVHESFHLLGGHHDRFDNLATDSGVKYPDAWNIAADCEINDDLLDFGREATLPADSYQPHHLGAKAGELAEDYYPYALRQIGQTDEKKTPQSCPECGGSGEGEPSPGGNSVPTSDSGASEADDDDLFDDDPFADDDPDDDVSGSDGDANGAGSKQDTAEDAASEGQGGGGADSDAQPEPCENCGGSGNAPDPDSAGCGSGAGGQPGSHELPDTTPIADAVKDVDAEVIRDAVAAEVRLTEKSSPGSAPGSLARWAADRAEPPKVPWQRLLRGAIRNALSWKKGQVDFTMARPARRHSQSPFYMPSMREPQISAGIVIDTSGSMNAEDLATAVANVESIMKGAQIRGRSLRVMSVDARVHSQPVEVQRVSDIKINGGGGTDMGVGLVAFAEIRPPVDICVVLTDGYTPWPATNPRPSMKTIVGIIGTKASIAAAAECYPPPAWATVVGIDVADGTGEILRSAA